MLVKKADTKQKTGILSHVLVVVVFLALVLAVYFVTPTLLRQYDAAVVYAPGFKKTELHGGFSDTVLQDAKLNTLEQRVELPVDAGQTGKRNPFNE